MVVPSDLHFRKDVQSQQYERRGNSQATNNGQKVLSIADSTCSTGYESTHGSKLGIGRRERPHVSEHEPLIVRLETQVPT